MFDVLIVHCFVWRFEDLPTCSYDRSRIKTNNSMQDGWNKSDRENLITRQTCPSAIHTDWPGIEPGSPRGDAGN